MDKETWPQDDHEREAVSRFMDATCRLLNRLINEHPDIFLVRGIGQDNIEVHDAADRYRRYLDERKAARNAR